MNEKISNKTLISMFWRLNFFQASWNYERMQSLAFLYAIKPVLEIVYKDKSKEEKSQAIKRHLEFFNIMPTFAAPILGITAALEEKEGNKGNEIISTMKISLMGPLSGLGDSLIWLTWMPICMSIAASFGKEGNPIGLILGFIMFNIVNLGIKFWGIKKGYKEGVKFLEETKSSNTVQRYTNIANIMGLILIGGLIPQMVLLKIPYIIKLGELNISIQEIIDNIIPNLLPIIATLLCFKFVKKGINTLSILFFIIIISILGSYLGIIG
ncbi:MAG: PTS system mannose/fructose/sorbose family transporter subunit IID [Cetobacterium sp.]